MTNLFYLIAIAFIGIQSPIQKINVDKVRKASISLSKAMELEDIKSIVKITIPETMMLPEYQNALETEDEIKNYFTQFFDLTETNYYSRSIIEIKQIDNYFLEIGTFQHDYKTRNTDWFSYKGKYMTWWTQSDKGKIKLLANIWGASSYTDEKHLCFMTTKTNERNPIIPASKIENKIYENIRYAKAAVVDGDYQKQLTKYTDDAMYLTYYDPPFIGKKAITKYFADHYNPEVTRDSVAIDAYRIIDMQNYVLTLGKYYVEWTYQNEKSYIHGKGLNLYKKVDDQLMIYRQMLNHSMPPRPLLKP